MRQLLWSKIIKGDEPALNSQPIQIPAKRPVQRDKGIVDAEVWYKDLPIQNEGPLKAFPGHETQWLNSDEVRHG